MIEQTVGSNIFTRPFQQALVICVAPCGSARVNFQHLLVAGLQVFGRAISEALATAPRDAPASPVNVAVVGSPAPQPDNGSDDDAVSGASPRSETRSFSERAGDRRLQPRS